MGATVRGAEMAGIAVQGGWLVSQISIASVDSISHS
jgi:hypothetical protein